jgi:hypothetical protein
MGDRLLGFEIGNEPGNYKNNGLRPSSYTFSDFEAEWKTFAKAIHEKEPSAALVGPADLTYSPPFATNMGKEANLVTMHYYRSSGVNVNQTQQLLNIDPYLANTLLPNLNKLTRAVPMPYRIGECNAFTEPATPGFALALWAIDFEFVNAMNHSSGVNFHVVPGEGPIETNNGKGTVTEIQPLYYAMKLFSMAANGTLLKTSVSAQQSTFSAYAVAGTNGSTYVVLNNKSPNNAAQVSIKFINSIKSATSVLLTAPSLTSKTGTTLGGVPIELDGDWHAPQTETVTVSKGAASIKVPSGSAVFIKALP